MGTTAPWSCQVKLTIPSKLPLARARFSRAPLASPSPSQASPTMVTWECGDGQGPWRRGGKNGKGAEIERARRKGQFGPGHGLGFGCNRCDVGHGLGFEAIVVPLDASAERFVLHTDRLRQRSCRQDRRMNAFIGLLLSASSAALSSGVFGWSSDPLFDHLLDLDEKGRRCLHQTRQHWSRWFCDDVDTVRLKNRADHGGIVGEFDDGWRYSERLRWR